MRLVTHAHEWARLPQDRQIPRGAEWMVPRTGGDLGAERSTTQQHTRDTVKASRNPCTHSCRLSKVAAKRNANGPQHLLKGSFVIAKASRQMFLKSSGNSQVRKESFSPLG